MKDEWGGEKREYVLLKQRPNQLLLLFRGYWRRKVRRV